MHRIYLIQQTHYQKDLYKIIVSEKVEHDLLKSYGKGTEVLGMIVINDNYREVEKQIKNSFNNKFRLFQGNEHYQGNRDEIKLEFLKIIYNYELRSLTEEPFKISEDNTDVVVESKVNDTSPILIRRNKFNNYEEIDTGLVFHKVTKKVIGKQISDGTISTDLSEEDIKNVNKYKFQIDCKDNSETGYSFIILLPL
jgi:hypothetical protein